VPTTIGENLRALRKAARLTQEQLAERAGVHQSKISGWETGTSPEVESLLRLAVGLAVSVDVLLAGVDSDYEDLRRKTVAAMRDSESGAQRAHGAHVGKTDESKGERGLPRGRRAEKDETATRLARIRQTFDRIYAAAVVIEDELNALGYRSKRPTSAGGQASVDRPRTSGRPPRTGTHR
jgi:transcriptional regulator with XRE-family HTH domain